MMPSEPTYKRAQPAIGTWLELSLQHRSRSVAQKLMSKAFLRARKLEKTFNIFDASSEISSVNGASIGKSMRVSPRLWQVVKTGARLEARFPGSFRLMPSCPHGTEPCYRLGDRVVTRLTYCSFDLGGIAKGFIVDSLFEWLTAHVPSGWVCVNAGGDLRVRERGPVELRIPTVGDEKRYVFRLRDAAVATSSTGGALASVGTPSARYFGSLPIATCAVVASRCMLADALTKVAIARELGAREIRRFGVQAILSFDRLGIPVNFGARR